MKRLFDIAVFLMLTLSANAFILLFRSGGAVEQGLDQAASNQTLFVDQLPKLWAAFAACLVVSVMLLEPRIMAKFRLPFAALYLVSALSVFWATYPLDAIRMVLLMLVATGLLHCQIAVYGIRHAVRVLAVSVSLILISSIVAVILLPSYGIGVGSHVGSWQGVFDHKNGLGNFAAVAVLPLLWHRHLTRRRWPLVMVLLAIVLVGGSRSGTGAILCALAVAATYARGWPRILTSLIRGRYLLLVFALAATSAEVFFYVRSDPSTLSNEELSAFTGRAVIWYSVFQQILEHPILGHGAGQFLVESIRSGGGDLADAMGFVVGSTHSGYLDIAYSFGVVGLLLMIAVFFRLQRGVTGYWGLISRVMPVLVVLSLNVTESRFWGFNFYYLFLVYVWHLGDWRPSQLPWGVVSSPEHQARFG